MTNCNSNVSEYRQTFIGKFLRLKLNVFFVMTYSLRVILCLTINFIIKTKVATNSIGPIAEKKSVPPWIWFKVWHTHTPWPNLWIMVKFGSGLWKFGFQCTPTETLTKTIGTQTSESQNQTLPPFIEWVKDCLCQIWGKSMEGRVFSLIDILLSETTFTVKIWQCQIYKLLI